MAPDWPRPQKSGQEMFLQRLGNANGNAVHGDIHHICAPTHAHDPHLRSASTGTVKKRKKEKKLSAMEKIMLKVGQGLLVYVYGM